jgi:hypothetical protein
MSAPVARSLSLKVGDARIDLHGQQSGGCFAEFAAPGVKRAVYLMDEEVKDLYVWWQFATMTRDA